MAKNYLTDVATAETLLRLVQTIPSPKAEPIKLWLAKVGYERMQEMADPAMSLERARKTWQQHGRSAKWIQQRMTGQETRNKHENKAVAVVGGRIAKQARRQLEQQTSRSVITSDNYLAPASKSVVTKTKKKTVKNQLNLLLLGKTAAK